MPYQDPDPTDPMTLHGVGVETDDPGAMRDMAECFVEEFCRLGFDRERILKLFTTAGYAGPHLAWRTLGAQTVSDIVDDCLRRWGPRAGRLPRDVDGKGDVMLPVLDQ